MHAHALPHASLAANAHPSIDKPVTQKMPRIKLPNVTTRPQGSGEATCTEQIRAIHSGANCKTQGRVGVHRRRSRRMLLAPCIIASSWLGKQTPRNISVAANIVGILSVTPLAIHATLVILV